MKWPGLLSTDGYKIFATYGTSTLAGEQLWQVCMLLFCNPRKIISMQWNEMIFQVDSLGVKLQDNVACLELYTVKEEIFVWNLIS